MRQWFDSLEPRERLILGIGAFASAIIVVWGLIWTPLHNGTAALRDAVDDKARLVVDLNRAADLAGGSSGLTRVRAAQSLVVLVDETARPLGLPQFTRTRPDGADAISVSFSETPFHTLLSWLIELEQTYGITVDSASFTEAREPGLVNGQVFLRRI
jgi:general secretion pathway protein M